MGSNSDLKEKAISLRKDGKSYNSIRKVLGIKSKGTLSFWFRDINLSRQSKKLLEKNNILAHKRGLFKANVERRNKIDHENKIAFDEGGNYISFLSSKELTLIGTALYWGEGTKSEKAPDKRLAFTNSDPYMIKVYMKFIREVLKVSEEKIRAGIHIYPSISSEKARRFWASITKLPEDRFYIVTQISRLSRGKRPNMLPYGTAVIKVNNRIQYYKVKGMISRIIEQLSE